MSYGRGDNKIWSMTKPQNKTTDTSDWPMPAKSFAKAVRLWHGTCRVVFGRTRDDNILPFAHTTIVFMHYLTQHQEAIGLVAKGFPWTPLSALLNSLLQPFQDYEWIIRQEFPRQPEHDDQQPLPEDYAMRGLGWVNDYFPDDWFHRDRVDPEKRDFKTSSIKLVRTVRILWLAYRIARHTRWLIYDEELHQFQAAPKFKNRTKHQPNGRGPWRRGNGQGHSSRKGCKRLKYSRSLSVTRYRRRYLSLTRSWYSSKSRWRRAKTADKCLC